MLTGVERGSTRVMLEFLNNTIHVFEGFLTLFQESGPTIHIVYDSMCQSLLMVMRRFMKTNLLEAKYGNELADIQCNDIKHQLSDTELNIGDETQKALGELKTDKQKSVVLGMRSFHAAAVSHIQTRLPINNTVERSRLSESCITINCSINSEFSSKASASAGCIYSSR